eukprot:127004_1
MRILPRDQRIQILSWIDNVFLNDTINPFLFHPSQSILLSGEEEATFDWLAVNFIFNKLQSNESTFGVLDLGGQSTQVAFIPQNYGNILEEFTGIRLWDNTYRLYTRSYLKYGTSAVDQRVAEIAYRLYTRSYLKDNNYTFNPCLPGGYTKTYSIDINGKQIQNTQVGSSFHASTRCYNIIRQLFNNNTNCYTKSCSFNNIYQ